MHSNSLYHYELDKEMKKTNVAGLLELYKRESSKHTDKCLKYATSMSRLNEEGKHEYEKEIDLMQSAKSKIAMRIVDILTK